jgi:hypothetical protein
MQSLRSLAWLLPTTTFLFVAYVLYAFLGALRFHLPIWLVLLPSLPALGLTVIALIVALLDVTRLPQGRISEESRLIWILVLIIFPVLAVLPYWLVVMRRASAATV